MADSNPSNSEAPAQVTGAKKKKMEKFRKRDPRSLENVMKNMTASTPEEKLELLQKAYEELYDENRTNYVDLQAKEKQYNQCVKEHDKDRAELSKSILAKGNLESLCRELQKQNKLIKEENAARIKEEEDRRKEMINNFTERLNALTDLVTESKDSSCKVKEENENMAQKLTELHEQYQQREQHISTLTRQLDLLKQLSETQAKKREIEHEAEKNTIMLQQRTLQATYVQLEEDYEKLQVVYVKIQSELELYRSRYNDFEATLTQSNRAIGEYKKKMTQMTRDMEQLAAQRDDTLKKFQNITKKYVRLNETCLGLQDELSKSQKKFETMQNLNRQLQNERGTFLKQLRDNSIEPSPAPKGRAKDKKTDGKQKQPVVYYSPPRTRKFPDLNLDETMTPKEEIGDVPAGDLPHLVRKFPDLNLDESLPPKEEIGDVSADGDGTVGAQPKTNGDAPHEGACDN